MAGVIVQAAVGFYGVVVWGTLLVVSALGLSRGWGLAECALAGAPCIVSDADPSIEHYLTVLSAFGVTLYGLMALSCRRWWRSEVRRGFLLYASVGALVLMVASNGIAVLLLLSPTVVALWGLAALPDAEHEPQ